MRGRSFERCCLKYRFLGPQYLRVGKRIPILHFEVQKADIRSAVRPRINNPAMLLGLRKSRTTLCQSSSRNLAATQFSPVNLKTFPCCMDPRCQPYGPAESVRSNVRLWALLTIDVVYEWLEEANDYGLVSVDTSGNPTPLADYTVLSSRWAQVSPSSIAYSAYTANNTAPACPTNTGGFSVASTVLPATPTDDGTADWNPVQLAAAVPGSSTTLASSTHTSSTSVQAAKSTATSKATTSSSHATLGTSSTSSSSHAAVGTSSTTSSEHSTSTSSSSGTGATTAAASASSSAAVAVSLRKHLVFMLCSLLLPIIQVAA